MCRRWPQDSPGRMLATLLAVSSLPAAFYAVFVAPRIRTWATTRTELTRAWPGDDLVPDPGFVWTNAITVGRPGRRCSRG
jgi:hypothetical protein